jgi:hypothetical protein
VQLAAYLDIISTALTTPAYNVMPLASLVLTHPPIVPPATYLKTWFLSTFSVSASQDI